MSAMGRRGLSSLRAVVVVVVVILIVYGVYMYNELQNELRKRDSREERVKRQLDTVSSELESLYEQKSNLEKAMKAEQEENKKSKDALEKHAQSVEALCTKEKEELSNRITAITTENKRLEGRNEDFQRELNKLQERNVKVEEDKNKIAEQYKQEYMQLKGDRDSTITQLRARVAELEQLNMNAAEELKSRVNDIHSLQNLLNASRQEYSKLEFQLKAVQHDFVQQRQRNQELIAAQEAKVLRKNANADGNMVNRQKHLPHAAATAAVHPHLAVNYDAGAAHVANAQANVASIRQHAGNVAAHIVNKEPHIQPGPRQQRDTANVNNDRQKQQHAVDNADNPPRPPHAAAML